MPRAKKAPAKAQEVCTCMEPKKLGLFFGSLLALWHLCWAILVASGFAQAAYNLVLRLHMLSIPITVLAFNPVMAIGLVLVTFIMGYIGGWIVALIWNWVVRCKCCT
jgi:hypothetical protein